MFELLITTLAFNSILKLKKKKNSILEFLAIKFLRNQRLFHVHFCEKPQDIILYNNLFRQAIVYLFY